jgi:hypothetical protein
MSDGAIDGDLVDLVGVMEAKADGLSVPVDEIKVGAALVATLEGMSDAAVMVSELG